jgi:plasmid stabilization system protein ParE
MVNRVRWNNRAILKMDAWVAYYEKEISFQSASTLIKTTRDKIDSLCKYPTKGRPVKSMKTIRFINIDKYHQLFYRVHGTTLFVTDLFDVRQNPDSKPYS